MELKYNNLNCRINQSRLLIAPLMELKFVIRCKPKRIVVSFNRTAYGIEI